jgi:cytochrome c6
MVQKFMFRGVQCLTILALVMLAALPTWAANITPSAQSAALFEVHCAGCHLNGGNIVRRGKTLKIKALQQNHVDTIEAIATLIANGKNNMSAYRDKLDVPQIEAIAHYVLDQAQKGWSKG